MPETLQGPGVAASATQGTVGAPGVVGGFFGVGQAQVAPAGPAPVTQQPGPSGVVMPLTGQNARNDSGAIGAAGRAARTPFNGQAADAAREPAPRTTVESQPARGAPQPGPVEGWRFRWHDDLWWYWTPQKQWVVWQANRWVPYQRGALYARGGLSQVNSAPAAAQANSGAPRVTAGYRPNYLGSGMYSQSVQQPSQSAPSM